LDRNCDQLSAATFVVDIDWKTTKKNINTARFIVVVKTVKKSSMLSNKSNMKKNPKLMSKNKNKKKETEKRREEKRKEEKTSKNKTKDSKYKEDGEGEKVGREGP